MNLSLELPSCASEASGNSAPTSMALHTGSGCSDAAFYRLLGNIRLHIHLCVRRREDLRNWEEEVLQNMDKKQKRGYCETTEDPSRYNESVLSTVDTTLCIQVLL